MSNKYLNGDVKCDIKHESGEQEGRPGWKYNLKVVIIRVIFKAMR